MTSEQLEKGNSISEELNSLKKELGYWETATNFPVANNSDIRVITIAGNWDEGALHRYGISLRRFSPESFGLLQRLNIDYLKGLIESLEFEFSKL